MRLAMLTPLLLLAAESARADNWPAWRGPNRDGISAEKGLPTSWAPDRNVLWRVDLPGAAGATPVVWEDRVFLVSPSSGREQVVLICIGTDGEKKWEAVVAKGVKKAKNIASASPSTDGKHVWAYCGTGDLVCFTVDGREVWRINLQQRYGQFKLSFGMTTTPVLHEGSLYIQLLHAGAYWIVAFDAATGKERWKAERRSDAEAECKHAYTSIQLWTGGDTPVLVSHGNDYTIGHGLRDGAEVWRLGGLNPKDNYGRTLRFVASPVVTKDLIVIPTAKNRQVVAIHPKGARELWRLPEGTPDVACPLYYEGLVYLSRKNGAVTCLDGKNGTLLYSEIPARESTFASPVAAGGHVYVTGRRGTVSVIQAGRTFKVVSVNALDDAFDASPAISNGIIYLRGTHHLWAIGKR